MAKPKVYRDDTFNGYPIYSDQQGSRQEILTAIQDIFTYMWRTCNQRLCVCHFTVNIPAAFDLKANDYLTASLQSWRRTMQNRKIRAEYVWGRERGDFASDGHPHYHVFVVIQGKFIQSAVGVAKHLNALLAGRLKDNAMRVHCNPPQKDNYQWGKKVSAKRGNLADAIRWVSYVAKVETKTAPAGQRTYGFSKGFLLEELSSALTPEEDRQEEAAFDSTDFSMTGEEWITWGGSEVNLEELLDFNPQTGGSWDARALPSVARR